MNDAHTVGCRQTGLRDRNGIRYVNASYTITVLVTRNAWLLSVTGDNELLSIDRLDAITVAARYDSGNTSTHTQMENGGASVNGVDSVLLAAS